MPYISVIIPCYNAEAYIDRCMKSLQTQTIGFENLEMILVNDGSTDGTLGKMLWWEQQFPNQIRVINCEINRKQGAARNTGLTYATAKYVGFLDVDDVIADRFYEKLYRKMEEGNYDWVSAKHVHILVGQEPDFGIPLQKADKEVSCAKEDCLLFEELEQGMYNGSFGVLPARIFRRDFIEKQELYFPEGLMYEDNYWSAKCGIFSKKIYIIDEVLYCYYMNLNSTVSSRNVSYHLDRMRIEEMVVALFQEQGIFKRYYRQIEYRFLQAYYCNTWYAIFMKMDTIPNVLPVMRQKIFELFPDYKNNPYIKNLPPINQMLLKLLEPEEVYTVEELVYVKNAFISYINGVKQGASEYEG